ncbi:hypothetical protein VTN00DRAFT_1014 [Thermoascus crustaceus]|uniref:uncharacterized protein n=1 Tax=Thermoascus crustaceus TaxID=5088 RepID=UPI0037431451
MSSSFAKLPGARWGDEHDPRYRPSTTASNDHPDHSLHIRSRSSANAHQSPRRLSVFSGRSRSNTTTSTSSRQSPASSMTSTDASSLRSREGRSGSTAGISIAEKTERTRAFFSRGSRILRRQGSKFSISATLDEEDEGDRERQKLEFFSRSHRSRQSDAHEQLKRIISDPFDFHHLTHTSPSQFQALDNASRNELVTEFSAIRASQKPGTELKGIRAEHIHFRNFSSEDLWNTGSATKTDEPQPTSAVSPPVSPRAAAPVSPSRRNSGSTGGSRGVENFSRPASRYQTAPGSPSVIPPPRKSSKQAYSDISEPAPPALDELLGLHTQQTYPDFVYSTSDDEAEISSLRRLDMVDLFRPDVGHAIAADECVRNTRRSSMIPDLEDVPEEDEATFWHESPEHSSRPSTSHSSHLDPKSAAAAPSTPSAQNSHLSVRVMSARFADSLASPTLPRPVPESPIPQAEDLRRKYPVCGKSILNDVSESWDDDIDYCYEHAAESNCNFDWDRTSVDERDSTVPGVSLTKPEDGDGNRALNPLYTSPSGLPTPELEHGSTQSLFTAHEVVTPLTSADEVEFIAGSKQPVQGDYFKPINAHILSSTSLGKEMTQDTLYEEYLAADGESDRHFSFYSQRGSQSLDHPISPRSSCSPLSKCNSQESMILSRAASIVRKHRSSVSTISVPELVHSASSSREYTFPENSGSVEQSIPVLGYPNSSSHHRQTQSLARNVAPHSSLKATCSDSSLDAADLRHAALTHDRAKSASAVETETSAAAVKADGPRMQDKGSNGKKTRTSYSLFPSKTGAQRP